MRPAVAALAAVLVITTGSFVAVAHGDRGKMNHVARGVTVAAASRSDAQTTHAYLVARYRLVTALLHKAAAARGAESAAAGKIAQECPGVVSGMPHEPTLRAQSALPPRARGEDARLAQQNRTIGEELETAIARPGDSLFRAAEEAYATEVRRLAWSNAAISSALQAAITVGLEALSAAAPPFCADAKTWAQSGFRALSAASREFEASHAARVKSEQGQARSVSTLLKPYENSADRALIRKTMAVERRLLAGDITAIQRDLRLKRTLGFPRAETEEPKRPIVLGHGRTAAGTRFKVSSESGFLGGPRCRRSATVAYGRPGVPEVLFVGGPNNPICISPPQFRHPELFCEVGIETVQTAVPASVLSVKLALANGRTIESHVIRVSRQDGGPVGIYAQEIRGSTSHAVSFVELNAGGRAVLTVKLPRYRCLKSRKQPEELPTLSELASGRTPEGETFTISAFGSFNGDPYLSVDTGVNPEINEREIGRGAGKAFPWSLSIGCAPHPYTILYGILASPGKSVVARTPQGAVVLHVVPVGPRVHAKGPLAYGVFSSLPSEMTVLGANGSTLYTEDLQAKETEVAQFCEDYAEP